MNLARNPGFELDVTDFFCGAGGASTGLAAAGFRVVTAANHWARAIQTHAANHPGTEHLCADINNLDMRRLPRTRVLWASVICTEISPAGGRRRTPTKGQLRLMEYGPIAAEAFERTRATALDVIRASEVHRYDIVVVENVVDFATDWELFDWWRAGMHLLGYTSTITCVSSAHVGGVGNTPAPQWRDRIYITFTRTGIRPPDLDPRPLAWCHQCSTDVLARQAWRSGNRVGKYARQYDYRCPNTACRHAVVHPYVLPAAAAIDWTNPGRRIGDRARPLVQSTMRKIRHGLATYTTAPSVITVNHTDHTGRAFPAHAAPLATRTVKIGDGLLTPPPAQTPALEPWRGIDPAGHHAARPQQSGHATHPAEAEGAFIAELRGGGSLHRPVTEPLATLTATGRHHGLVIPYRNASPRPTSQPLHTLSTVDSAALLHQPRPAPDEPATAAVSVEDCYFRMLTPREQLAGQRFAPDYVVHGNQAEQTMQAGNAVSVNVAHWIGQQIASALDQR